MLKQLIYHVTDPFKLNKNPINPGQNRPGHQGLYQFSRRGYPIHPPTWGRGGSREEGWERAHMERRQRNSVLLTSPTEPPYPPPFPS